MVNFYSSHDTSLPELPSTFTLSTINPASFGGRGNLVILQLSIPFRYFTFNIIFENSFIKIT